MICVLILSFDVFLLSSFSSIMVATTSGDGKLFYKELLKQRQAGTLYEPFLLPRNFLLKIPARRKLVGSTRRLYNDILTSHLRVGLIRGLMLKLGSSSTPDFLGRDMYLSEKVSISLSLSRRRNSLLLPLQKWPCNSLNWVPVLSSSGNAWAQF